MSEPAASVAAFEAVYRAEVRGVWRFLARLGIRGPATDDLTHQTFMVAFTRWTQLDPGRPAGPWLRGIAWRIAADYQRLHLHTEAPIESASGSASSAQPVDEQVASRRALSALEAALDDLNPDQRAVFVMYEIENLPLADIAREMGVSLPTVTSRLRLARHRLGQLLAPHREGRTG